MRQIAAARIDLPTCDAVPRIMSERITRPATIWAPVDLRREVWHRRRPGVRAGVPQAIKHRTVDSNKPGSADSEAIPLHEDGQPGARDGGTRCAPRRKPPKRPVPRGWTSHREYRACFRCVALPGQDR